MADASHKALQVLELLKSQEKLKREQRFRKLFTFKPYPKQKEFYGYGATHDERLLSAGNQVGKSEAGAFEFACHMTGRYPPWWIGKRYTRPIRAWIAGESTTAVRDIQQNKLCGKPGVLDDLGTGMIPLEDFVERPSTSRGATDAFDTMQVKWHDPDGKHRPGNTSTATFKSYEQGRTKFQGEPMDLIWGDEEMPMDIYSECLARLTATKGMMYITFTPLKGRTDLVIRFWDEEDSDRIKVQMAFEDAAHIDPEDYEKILKRYPAHERDARSKGVPLLGSGRIFSYPMEMLQWNVPTYIPLTWKKLWGIDFGIGHPFAAVLALYDADNDIIYIYDGFRLADNLPIVHAQRMKEMGAAVPVAWPQDGTAREKSGETVSNLYKKAGLLMHSEHATWTDGGYGTEAGILEMQQRIETGKFKVASHLSDWFDEYQNYHRKNGEIVKVHDDLMSATRMVIMMKRIGRPVALGKGGRIDEYGRVITNRESTMARGLDYDIWSPNS